MSNILAKFRGRPLPMGSFCCWKENGIFGKMRKDQFVRDSNGGVIEPWDQTGKAGKGKILQGLWLC